MYHIRLIGTDVHGERVFSQDFQQIRLNQLEGIIRVLESKYPTVVRIIVGIAISK